MLLLAMTCLRVDEHDADFTRAVMRGDMHDGLRIGLARLERVGGRPVGRQAVLGQVLAQVMLALGRAEQAEELLQRQLRLYESLPRAQMRCLASLDRGYFWLALNRPGRAAEGFNVVADGNDVPLILRLEALLGLSDALSRLGEWHRASRTLDHAIALARPTDAMRLKLIRATRLEHQVMHTLRDDDESLPSDGNAHAKLLRTAADGLAEMPVALHRLRFLASLIEPNLRTACASAQLVGAVRWWHERRMHQTEELARIDAALALLKHGEAAAATELLGPLATDAALQNRHRRMTDLKYCASKLYAIQGRHAEALRSFRQHASHVLSQLRSELKQVPYSRFLEQREQAETTSLDQLSLPPRYRKAFRFIRDHLHDEGLTVRRIAAHVEVSERALQSAFRNHLGLTPSAVVRQLRLAGIRAEIQCQSSRENVLEVAKRWGTGSRSALAKSFREQFNEAPGSTADRHGAVTP